MAVRLTLTSTALDAPGLHALARDFCRQAEQETGIRAELAEGAAAPGTRGSAIDIGNILLTFASSGAAVALINVGKSFFERNSSIELHFEREDGKKLSIKAQNVNSEHIAKTLETIREFFGAAG